METTVDFRVRASLFKGSCPQRLKIYMFMQITLKFGIPYKEVGWSWFQTGDI